MVPIENLFLDRTIDEALAASRMRWRRRADALVVLATTPAVPDGLSRKTDQAHREDFVDAPRTPRHVRIVRRALAVLLLSLPGLSFAQALPERHEPRMPLESIGTATMEPGGTIVLQLRTQEDNGMLAEALLRYSPDDPGYAMVLRHIGQIPPGKTVFVRPFPQQDRMRRAPNK